MINGKDQADQPTPPTSVELLAEAQKMVALAILGRIKASGGINPLEMNIQQQVNQIEVTALAELLVSKGIVTMEEVVQATTKQMRIFAKSSPTVAVAG